MATDKLVDFDHVTDYISREAAIRAHCDGCVDDGYCGKLDGRYACEDVPAIMAIPAADVRPVVRASFVSASDGYGICSNCNRGDHIDPLAGFCRFCGADMREVVE